MTNQNNRNKQEIIPPLELRSLILPFYTQALVKLGQLIDPITNEKSENLKLAKRLIDILDLLKTKTQGNLTDEEVSLLDDCISQLKNVYLEKINIFSRS